MMRSYPNEIDTHAVLCVHMCIHTVIVGILLSQVAPKRSLLIDCGVEPNWMRLALSPPFATITIYQMMHMNVGPMICVHCAHIHAKSLCITMMHARTHACTQKRNVQIGILLDSFEFGMYPFVCVLLISIFPSICSILIWLLLFDCQAGCTIVVHKRTSVSGHFQCIFSRLEPCQFRMFSIRFSLPL